MSVMIAEVERGHVGGYFHLDLNPHLAAETLRHQLNRHYRGSKRYELQAPDAAGVLVIWARDEAEARDHAVNALFDLVFARKRIGVEVGNPPCPECGARSQARGRNPAGSRQYRCTSPSCLRWFTPARRGPGGVADPQAAKRAEFHQRVFVMGQSIRAAGDALSISRRTGRRWYARMRELRRQ